MSREELKEIVSRVIDKVQEEKAKTQAPQPACFFFGDSGPPCDSNPCDVTTFYAVGEEG